MMVLLESSSVLGLLNLEFRGGGSHGFGIGQAEICPPGASKCYAWHLTTAPVALA
jgi:hypothetical protein